MPIEVGLWKLGDRPVPVSFERLESESRLENLPFLDLLAGPPTGQRGVHAVYKCGNKGGI